MANTKAINSRVHVSLEGQGGQLVIDGPLSLLSDLLRSFQPALAPVPRTDAQEVANART